MKISLFSQENKNGVKGLYKLNSDFTYVNGQGWNGRQKYKREMKVNQAEVALLYDSKIFKENNVKLMYVVKVFKIHNWGI